MNKAGRVTAFVFGVLALATWRRSGDLLIDFGRELYIPWRITEGDVLYRDIESLMGPASAYFNAAVFRIAGASLTTLLATNLIILALVTMAIAVFFRRVATQSTLLLMLLSFLFLFGFAQVGGRGNYSFLSPYSHEATHGMLLAILALIGVLRANESGGWSVVGGLALGATFLTKPDLFLATAVACLSGWLLCLVDRPCGVDLIRRVGMFAISALVFPLVAFGLFSTAMPMNAALSSAAGAWAHVGGVRAADLPYYLWNAGFDRPTSNILGMFAFGASILGIMLVACRLDSALGPRLIRSRRWRLAATTVSAAVAASLLLFIPMLRVPQGLPVLVAAGIVFCLAQGSKGRSESFYKVWAPLVVWGVFSLVLLARIILAVRIYHYGFYLAMPATLFVLFLGFQILPDHYRRDGGGLVRRVFLALALVFSAFHVGITGTTVAARTYEVGRGADRLRYFGPSESTDGRLLNQLTAEIDRLVPRDETLAVLPEGAGLNFLVRRPNSTRHISIMPPELHAFAETKVLADFKNDPPSFLVIWDRSLDEYGYGRFADDRRYAAALLNWIDSSYDSVRVFGDSNEVDGLYRKFVILSYRQR